MVNFKQLLKAAIKSQKLEVNFASVYLHLFLSYSTFVYRHPVYLKVKLVYRAHCGNTGAIRMAVCEKRQIWSDVYWFVLNVALVRWHQILPLRQQLWIDLIYILSVSKGCLQVIPGSHKGPLYNHHDGDKFASEINDPNFDSSGAVHLEVPAGGISLHHPFTVHGSAANQSNEPRRYFVFSFSATDAWPLIS